MPSPRSTRGISSFATLFGVGETISLPNALVPLDIAQRILDLFGIIGCVIGFFTTLSFVLVFPGQFFELWFFWTFLLAASVQLAMTLLRGLPFLFRYWILVVALFAQLTIGSINVGISPNWIAGILLIVTTNGLFFGMWRGIWAILFIIGLHVIIALGWAKNFFPIDRDAYSALMDFHKTSVWARVLVTSLLNLTAILLIISFVVRRLNKALGDSQKALSRAATEQAEKTLALGALFSSEERFAKAFRNNPTAMLISRKRDGLVIEINGALASLLGVSPELARGTTARELGIWNSEEERRKMIDELERAGRIQNQEVFLGHGKGEPHLCSISVETVTIGNEECLLAIAQDIHQQRRAEEERQKLQTQLFQTQKMDAVGHLAGGVAHDFNNILAAVQLQLGFLKTDRTLSKESLELIDESISSIQRGAALTRQLLLFSRKQTMQCKEIDAVAMLEGVSSMLRRLVGASYTISVKASRPSLLIDADQSMIEQVILNLVVNARDAMPAGGNIQIGIDQAGRDEIRDPSKTSPNGYVRFSVVDEGTGMSPENQKRLFEPFFTTKEKGKGTGLGLSTAFGIVREHGGWIEVQSEIGRGSRFSVFIPASAGSLGAKQPK